MRWLTLNGAAVDVGLLFALSYSVVVVVKTATTCLVIFDRFPLSGAVVVGGERRGGEELIFARFSLSGVVVVGGERRSDDADDLGLLPAVGCTRIRVQFQEPNVELTAIAAIFDYARIMREGIEQAITQLHAAVDSLLAAGLDSLTDTELVDVVRDAESAVRRLAPVEQRLTAEVDRRAVAFAHGCADTKTFLRQLLRLSAPEAAARVKAADRFATRHAVSGERLSPLLPAVAAAQAAGEISARHAALIGDTIDKLPAAVDEAGEIAGIESFLVDQAKQFTPETLGSVARRLVETIDPDGTLRDVEYRDRRRSLVIRQRPDGSVFGKFEGTAELGELLLTTLDVLAAPKPATDGTPDTRSAEQRNHDGMCDALRLVIRSQQLPPANGVLATIVLTMTETQWRTGQGLARTGHGALLPVSEAKNITGGETRLFPVVLADTGPPGLPEPSSHWLFKSAKSIHAYGTCHRIFTERERLAMAARDGGCTFPGCMVPAAWCEADHITDYAITGRTSVDDGHLLCPFHHREKVRNGWHVLMLDAIPHWLAPTWLDPEQVPRRNHAHDPVGVG